MKFWQKHCISSPFFAPPADLQMSIKSEPLPVRVNEQFLKPAKMDL